MKEAKQRLTAELAALDNGTFVDATCETVTSFLSRWITTVEGSLSARTVEGYKGIISRVINVIGNNQLRKLSPMDIQGFFSNLLGDGGRSDGKGGLSPLTVVHFHRLLHKAFKDAVAWGLIARNPVNPVKAPKAKGKGLSFMTANEINMFLQAAEATDYHELFHCFLFTGTRRSELLACRWRDFNADKKTLSISRTLHQLEDRSFVFSSTKSARSRRTIALSPTTVLILEALREKIFTQRLELGLVLQDDDLIFAHYDGSPLSPGTISHAWSKLAKKLGITASNLHLARHSHASLLLSQGVHPKIVQERLGHSNISITLDIYSHVMPGLQEGAVLKFEEALKVE